ATAGTIFASLLGLDPATFAAVGLVAVLAGAANTPIAASIMAVELFGPKIVPYATVACVISFLMTGHRSVYSSQILAMKKSPFLSVKTGEEIDKAEAEFSDSLTKVLVNKTKKIVFRTNKINKSDFQS
ncbi:MAG TPA: chloride channel protein, partial [Candidatus Omnitrophota bacterium]|nr:chloride channel protein [Candidatus Omnitrophota bacterium]